MLHNITHRLNTESALQSIQILLLFMLVTPWKMTSSEVPSGSGWRLHLVSQDSKRLMVEFEHMYPSGRDHCVRSWKWESRTKMCLPWTALSRSNPKYDKLLASAVDRRQQSQESSNLPDICAVVPRGRSPPRDQGLLIWQDILNTCCRSGRTQASSLRSHMKGYTATYRISRRNMELARGCNFREIEIFRPV